MNNWTVVVRDRLTHLSGEPADPELVEELAAHLTELYDDALAEGLSPPDARARALHVLDASDRLRETLQARQPAMTRRISAWSRQEIAPGRSKGVLMSWSSISRDARHAVRMILNAPAFSLIAICTFAVGIGVNTAVFSVINGVLLHPLPYPDADQITMIWMDNRRQGIKEDITSYPNYRDWRDQNSSFAHVAGVTPSSFTLTGVGEAERLMGAETTANFFAVMGLPPVIGRTFAVENEVEGQDSVTVISHGLWQRRFGGAHDVIGRTITLNGRPHEVIGVMPAALQMPEKTELWKPLAPSKEELEGRGFFWLPVMGRLKPGISVEQAQAEMTGIASRLEQTYQANRGFGVYLESLREQLIGDVERPLIILLSAVGFVLLIACANLANLMLGRTSARRKEIAIRSALGAGRGRVIRQIVTETFVLALIGAALGLILAYWTTGFFVALGGETIPRADVIGLSGPVLAFALLLATAAALLAGIVPAIQAARADVADHLREGGRQSGATASRRTRSVLVAAEVALALVLLTGAGLLVRTLWSMQTKPRGFTTENVAKVTIGLSAVSYPRPENAREFWARLLDRVRALPGVEAAATTTGVLQPVVTNSGTFSFEGKPPLPPEERAEFPVERVSPGFFETLNIPLVRGRTFTEQDHATATLVIVINESLARMGWGDEDPIGRRMKSGGPDSTSPWLTVIGVIRDIHRADVTRAIRPELYRSSLQQTPGTQTLIVRTAGDPSSIIPLIRREVNALDPQLALYRVGTLEEEFAKTLTQPRFQATLLAVFAAIALLLAAIGVYGVTSHAVRQRTQEVGIRMALGAHRGEVLKLILTQHLQPAIAGLIIGVIGAVLLSRYIRSLLYGVGPTDPLTFTVTAGALLAVAAAASWIPAWRATRVDPLNALRTE